MPTLRQLFSLPEWADQFGPERLQRIEAVLTGEHSSDLPWYLRFLIGAGAWLASFFFIGFFLSLFGFHEDARTGFGIIGLVLLAGAMVIVRLNPNLFLGQCCLAACLAGQGMIYFGFLPDSAHALDYAVVLSIGLAGLVYALYPDFLPRLITCFAALVLTHFWIMRDEWIFSSDDSSINNIVLWLPAFSILQLAALIACFALAGRWSATLAPLGYALLFSLTVWGLQVIFPLTKIFYSSEESGIPDHAHFIIPPSAYIYPAFSALVLLGVIIWAAGGLKTYRQHPLPFLGVA